MPCSQHEGSPKAARINDDMCSVIGKKGRSGMNERRAAGYVLVALGRAHATNDSHWLQSGFVRDIIRLQSAVPSGLRLGSRALGLGLDSLIVATKALIGSRQGPYLAANPWVGAALVAVGKREIAVTGIYAKEGSRSYRILRRLLRDAPVVTTVDIEAAAWIESGGRALPVLYGNTFGYPPAKLAAPDVLSIFVGGSSDRDAGAIDRLEEIVRVSSRPIKLTIVAHEPASQWSRRSSSVVHTGSVSPEEFGRLMASADAAFLPLRAGARAAGHMVAVGALEAGVPVLTTPSPGMNGYIDGRFVRSFDASSEDLLSALEERKAFGAGHREEIRAFWSEHFSLPAYVRRVGNALATLQATRESRA